MIDQLTEIKRRLIQATEGSRFLRDIISTATGDVIQLHAIPAEKPLLWVATTEDLDTWAYRRSNSDWDQ